MRRIKTGVYVIEGLNSFAVTFFFSYFYFFMERKFGFGNKANLVLAAASGLIYVPAALFGGRFAQRAGYFTSLKLGFGIMLAAIAAAWLLDGTAVVYVVCMLAGIFGMCFTWPTLEALISEGETRAGLQHNVGIYNVVWAATNALAYFTGGAMLDKLGLHSLFYVPIICLGLQLTLAVYLERTIETVPRAKSVETEVAEVQEKHPHPPAMTKAFMRMAWLANPSAYLAINTLIAVMPSVGNRLELSTTQTGLWCSIWCFVRLGMFFVLWFWPGWHYKFRWLLTSYLALIASFASILIVPNLVVVVLAQLAFGAAIGLIYYSSLYYSMDTSETKGEHGGIHEAAIGFGNFAGPAVGALSLHFSPVHTHGGAGAVSALLVLGLFGLLAIRSLSLRRG